MERKQAFRLTGVTNSVQYATPLTSTQAEKKRCLYIALQVNGYADNDVLIFHETTEIQSIPDTLIDVETPAFTENESKPGARITQVEVGLDLPVGEKIIAAIKCGATAKNLRGFYAYEVITG